MALTWKQTGTDERGAPTFTVTSDSKDPHFLYTAPQSEGIVRAADGTSYEVTPPVIEVASKKHAEEVAHGIARQLHARGLLGDPTDPKLKHLRNEEK